MRRRLLLLVLVPALLLCACEGIRFRRSLSDPVPATGGQVGPLASRVNDFLYQLQGPTDTGDPLDIAAIEDTNFDLVVIDYSSDGSEGGQFTPGQVASLKASAGNPGQTKIVLAYMSIGEAEIGRFYWDNAWVTPDPTVEPDGPFTLTPQAPGWLTEPNPAFPDNFKVRFWMEGWQQIIHGNPGGHPIIGDAASYLDRIIDAGFDGVYLDIIDGFEHFGPVENGGNDEKRDAAADMVDFVRGIARYAHTVRGVDDFLVFPQNGSRIIRSGSYPDAADPDAEALTRRIEYFTAIDGLGAEDTFYFGDQDENNPLDIQTDTLASINEFRAAGKLILSIDYLTEDPLIGDFYQRARQEAWVPYASVRLLDRIMINPTQPPD